MDNNNNFDNNGYDNGGDYSYGYDGNMNGYEQPDVSSDTINVYDQDSIDLPSSNSHDASQYSSSAVGVDDNFAESTESTLNSLNDELTDAEREDIRRERAAKKRKRMLREKRRRERRRRLIIRWCIFIAAIILVLVIIVKIFTGIGSLLKSSKHKKTTEEITTEATTTEEPVAQIDENILAKEIPTTREKAMELLKEQAETDVDIKNICENEAIYPDIVLEHLAANSELIEFALHYPAQISVPFDGDFTIEDANTTEAPLFLCYDSRWAYADYGKTVLGLNGDAPVSLSMAYVYLTKDGSKNPIIIGDFSMDNGYLDESGTTDYKLMTEGADELGLESVELNVDKDALVTALEDGQAVICAVSSGDFTKDNGYIVIREYRNGFFYVNDPNSKARSEVGWDFKRLSSQIKKMWGLKRGTAATSTDEAPTTDADGEAVDSEGTDDNAGAVGNENGTGTDNDTPDGDNDTSNE